MDRRILGIIIIICGLLLIAGIVYFIFIYRFAGVSEPVTTNEPVTQTQPTQPVKTNSGTVSEITPAKKVEVGENELKRMAMAFAERFGSYSNQSDFGNVKDLKIFMSQKMLSWADNYVNNAKMNKIDSNIYYGITTKAVAADVNNYDNDLGLSEILVKTLRREAAGVTGNASSFSQNIIIKFVKENSIWKVDAVTWQSK